jgi:tetratricopeptide (TPR) repeat protein
MMRDRLLHPVLFLLAQANLLLCPLPAADTQAGGQEAAAPGQADFFETHKSWRSRVLAYEDVSAEIHALAGSLGDHSFDSLLHPSRKTVYGLRLQEAGRASWNRGENREAARLFRQSLGVLKSSGAVSEAAFSCYLLAELCSEEERYPEALTWLDRASDFSKDRDRFYLEALISQSYGYVYWFMDRLQWSALAFSGALVRWQRLGMRVGITVTWSNLGSLYEEMNIPGQAGQCYEKALESAQKDLFEEVRFYLHHNFALFLLRQGDRSRGLFHLEEARSRRGVSPAEFAIAEFQFFPDEARLEKLLTTSSGVPSIEVDRALALGNHWLVNNNLEAAYPWLSWAVETSNQKGLSLPERRAAGLLGKCLEKRGEYEKAEELYRHYVERNWNLQIPEVLFPYSETVAPLFDGWVRSLVRLNRDQQALHLIQSLSQIRRNKAARLSELGAAPGEITDELAQLAMADELELPAYSMQPMGLTQGPAKPADYCVLELWPEGRQVFAWVTTPSGRRFIALDLPLPATRIVAELAGAFYSTGGLLPAPPPFAKLQDIYHCLFRPIERFLDSVALLVIPHKELQALPLEILVDEKGRYLLHRYHFSYLPAWDEARPVAQPKGDPVLVLPRDAGSLPESRRDAYFFQTLFPSVRLVREMEQGPAPAAWVHITSHFQLDDRFWVASGFSDGAHKLNALRFVKESFECSVLSLGACHVANGFTSRIPYWLGFCEVFLAGRIQAMVVSRWEMDELAAPIYRDFYLHCKRGKPMDEALSLARRGFWNRPLRRGAVRVSGRHPFFWAGISYVGEPGTHLFTPEPSSPLLLLCLPLPVLACLALMGRRAAQKL